MFVFVTAVQADNARRALGLPGLPLDLRAWLKSVVLSQPGAGRPHG
jgi:hypothetical protein